MENGIGRPGGRAAGTSFDRYRNTGNTSNSNYNTYSNFNSYANNNNNNNNQSSLYQSNNYNHNSSHNSNHSNNQSNSSSNSYNSPTTDLLRPDYSKRNSSSYNLKHLNNNSNSIAPIFTSKPNKSNNNNPGHLALLQQSANAAGKSFADTVQRPTFFVNELENAPNGFFKRKGNQGTPSPTYSGNSNLLAKSSKQPKIQPKINSKTEFPTLGGLATATSLLGIPSPVFNVTNSNLSVFGQPTGAALSKSTAAGFASALTGAPKDQSDSPAAKLPNNQTIVQQSSILITTRKKTGSGGSGKKKSKNLAKELFSLTDSSVLDRNNNQISSESETSPGKTKKDSKKEKKLAKSVKKEAEKSGKIKTSKKKTASSESDNNKNCVVQCEHEGNVENQVPSEQSANNGILNRDIGLLWDQELEKKLIRQMRERCHDCFVEEEEDKMITDSEIQEMQEFMKSIQNQN